MRIPTSGTLIGFNIIGIATSSGSDGNTIRFVSQGLITPVIFNLGDGYNSKVGWNSSGNAIRTSDNTNISGLDFVGTCDGYGNVYVSRVRVEALDPRDDGCPMDGIHDDYPGFRLMLDAPYHNIQVLLLLIYNYQKALANCGFRERYI